jgi:hypothetical protein
VLRLLPGLVLQAILLLGAAAALLLSGVLPQLVAAHVAFAVGLMPLIMAAMLHFIPVLTRTGAPHPVVAAMPLLAWAGGIAMLSAFVPPGLGLGALHGGAALALVAAVTLLLFAMRRVIDCLGAPHPSIYWYQAALLCLALALCAVFAMAAWSGHYREMRLVHLHLNTLGFVALTALGTLEVLVPTVLARADAEAARRLRRALPAALAGVLLVAIGVAWLRWLADLGTALLLVIVWRSGRAWWRRGRQELLAGDGAAASLFVALCGFGGLLLLGDLHAHGIVPGFAAVPGFVAAFLLPLVTGAASYLLPVWWRPGPQGAWHRDFRSRLGRRSLLRAVLFCAGGLAAGAGWIAALWLTAVGLLLFASALGAALIGAFRRDDGQVRPSR